MKTIKITIDASNMNAEELGKAIKKAILENGSEKEESVDAIKKELAKELEEIEKLVDDNLNEQITVDQLSMLLNMFRDEKKRLKNIFKVN